MKIIGIDVGATKMDAALIEENKIIQTSSCPTPADQPFEESTAALKNLIHALNSSEVTGIGIGVPGLVDLETNEVIDVVHIPAWKQLPLKHLLEQQFHKPVFVNNDANCFAIGEKYFGKGKAYGNFVGVTMGTALGAGIIINNQLYSGKFCGAGEFGAMIYRDKTVEDFTSGLFFKQRNLSGDALAALAFSGDKEAIGLFNELGEHIGWAISFILFALAPEAIILGGSVSKSFTLFEHSMRSLLERKFPFQRLYKALKIEVSDLKNSAVLGAASLVLNELSKRTGQGPSKNV